MIPLIVIAVFYAIVFALDRFIPSIRGWKAWAVLSALLVGTGGTLAALHGL
jgi:hypothetical protein